MERVAYKKKQKLGEVVRDLDVIREARRLTGGRYDHNKLRSVLNQSISYIKGLCRITDRLAVKIPHIGYMIANRAGMRREEARLTELRKDYYAYTLYHMEIKARRDRELEALRRKLGKMDRVKRGRDTFHLHCRALKGWKAGGLDFVQRYAEQLGGKDVDEELVQMGIEQDLRNAKLRSEMTINN
jgi:hypothetical protein